jgi:hypothetical protein
VLAGLLLIIAVIFIVVATNSQRGYNDTSQIEIDNQLEEYRAVANDSADATTGVVAETETGLKNIIQNQDLSLEQRYKAINTLSGLYYNSGRYEDASRALEDYFYGAGNDLMTEQQSLQIWGSLASAYRKQGNIAKQKEYLELIEANLDQADDEFLQTMYIGWLEALREMGY